MSALSESRIETQRRTTALHRQAGHKVSLLGLLVLFTGLCISAFMVAVQSLVVLIAFCLFGIVGLLVTKRWGKTASRLFVLVYCCSVLATVALYAIYSARYGTPYYVGGSDDLAYEEWAEDVVSSLGIFDYSSIRGGVVSQSHNSVGYVYLVSLLHRASEPLGGFHTMLPRLLNCLALALIAVLTYLLGKCHNLPQRTSRRIAVLVGLLPIMMYTAAHTSRDIIISLLTMWVVYIWSEGSDRFGVRRRFWLWVQTLMIAGIVGQLRIPQAVAILTIALVGDLVSSERKFGRFSREKIYHFVVVAVLCVAVLFVFQDRVVEFIDRLSRGQESYSQYRVGLSDGLGAYVFSAPAPLTYVLRILYALVIPLPVFSQEPDRLWLSAGTVIQYLFLPFLVAGFVRSIHDRSKRQLLSAFMLLFGGTAFISFTGRHIVQFLPYGALIAGMGFERYRKYRSAVWLAILWLGFGLVITYVVLKSA